VRLTSTSEVCIYQTWYARLDIPKVTIDTTIETNAILDPKNITRKISKSNKEEWEIEETRCKGAEGGAQEEFDRTQFARRKKITGAFPFTAEVAGK
jgi:hypothetical protein